MESFLERSRDRSLLPGECKKDRSTQQGFCMKTHGRMDSGADRPMPDAPRGARAVPGPILDSDRFRPHSDLRCLTLSSSIINLYVIMTLAQISEGECCYVDVQWAETFIHHSPCPHAVTDPGIENSSSPAVFSQLKILPPPPVPLPSSPLPRRSLPSGTQSVPPERKHLPLDSLILDMTRGTKRSQ